MFKLDFYFRSEEIESEDDDVTDEGDEEERAVEKQSKTELKDRDSNKQDNNQLSDEEKGDEDEELENEENKTDLSIARSMEADEIKQRLLCKYNNSPGKSFFYKIFLALTFSVLFFLFHFVNHK